MGLTLSDLLGLVLTGLLIVISLGSIWRRNGNGLIASDAQQISASWRMLTQEQRREIEILNTRILLLMDQLQQLCVEPATIAQAESIYDTIKILGDEFSIDELDTLMLAINIKPDSIAGDTIEERARELVLAADRRGKLVALIHAMHRERPR